MNMWDYFWKVGKEMEKMPYWKRFLIALGVLLTILFFILVGKEIG